MVVLDPIYQATHFIQEICDSHDFRIDIAIVLGSGLDSFAEVINPIAAYPYCQVPNFPQTSVPGHPGELVMGYVNGMGVMAFKGRVHLYEGYTAHEAAFFAEVVAALGIKRLIVSNAVGGMRPELYLGALMLIEDHINYAFQNPLIGYTGTSVNAGFTDMSDAYCASLRQLAMSAAKNEEMKLHQGVYGGISGPSYLSRAELKMLRRLGADVVGMSSIHEVIAAKNRGLEVLGISCVTDMVVPESLEPLDHEMVVRVAQQTRPKFAQLVTAILGQLQERSEALS